MKNEQKNLLQNIKASAGLIKGVVIFLVVVSLLTKTNLITNNLPTYDLYQINGYTIAIDRETNEVVSNNTDPTQTINYVASKGNSEIHSGNYTLISDINITKPYSFMTANGTVWFLFTTPNQDDYLTVNASHVSITGINIKGNNYQSFGYLVNTPHVTISNATVADIGAITLNGFGIAFVDGAHYGTVQYCYVHNIGLDGIHFRSSDYGKIQYNDVRLTGDDGVAFCLCEYGLMLNNTIDRSLDRNWASNARLAGSKYCTIQSNTLIGSPNHGICCDGFKEVIPKSNQFIQNTFQNCTKSDIYAEGTYTKTTNLISKP